MGPDEKMLQKKKEPQQIQTGTKAVTQTVSRQAQSAPAVQPQQTQNNLLSAKLPLVMELKEPKKQTVLKAHEETGLKLSYHSLKHPKRYSRAREKYALQKELKQKQGKKYIPDPARLDAAVKKLEDMDLSRLMYDQSDLSGEEKLLKNYENLKKTFVFTEAFGKSLEEDKKKENPSDEDKAALVKKEAHYKTLTDVKDYYAAQEGLMSNRYYALVPRTEMKELSEETLRARLQKLYAEKQETRNKDLIDYYQNLLRMKLINLSDGESVKKREKAYRKEAEGKKTEVKRDPAKEMEKITDGYFRMLEAFGKKNKFYSEEDMRARRHQYFSVLGKDIDAFRNKAKGKEAKQMLFFYDEYLKEKGNYEKYKDSGKVSNLVDEELQVEGRRLEKREKEPAGIRLTPEQKEGMRLIQGFLLRRCYNEKTTRESFVASLLQAPPEQQLLTFYLIENGKTKSAIPADFYEVLSDYQPNLNKFRDKVDKHFYNKGHTKWDKLSDAVQKTRSMREELNLYGEISTRIEETEKKLDEAKADPGRYMEQGRLAVTALNLHKSLLDQMYRTSGMHEEMTVDLAKNAKLKKRMEAEFLRIQELSAEVSSILSAHPELEQKKESETDKTGTAFTEKEKKSAGKKALDAAKTGKKIVKVEKTVESIGGGIAGVFTGAVKKLKNTNAYKISKASLADYASIVGLTESLYDIFQSKQDETVTDTENFVRKITRGKNAVNAAKVVTSDTMTVLQRVGKMNAEGKTAQVAGKALKGVGLVTGVVTTAVSSVKLGQAISKGQDVRRAEKKLKQQTQSREKTKDDRKLARFLKHEKRDTNRQRGSASVDLAMNVVNNVSNVMTMTGVLAPLAAGLKITTGVVTALYGFFDKSKRKMNIKRAVDEYLGVERIMNRLKAAQQLNNMPPMKDDELQKMAREEALGHMGYSTYKQCFTEVCRDFAELLHEKTFQGTAMDLKEWDIYNTALEALGFKKLPYVSDYGDNPQPSVDLILAKIMS